MRIAFRTDASIDIGTGHVMRCLTLADALRARGAECFFLCRAHKGNLINLIASKGYRVHSLPIAESSDLDLAHSHWLNSSQSDDAQACIPILAGFRPEWMVVDHYALDLRWESSIAPHIGRLMVIDDLADRRHACQVLLDQTLARPALDYKALVSSDCSLLCGAEYALLREEFVELRPYSLSRRMAGQVNRVLVTMGGVDKGNVTCKVLASLRQSTMPMDWDITVVMGPTSPWLSEVERCVKTLPWPSRVFTGASNMAQLIADSDLTIGAAGATAWERCCLGSPTLMLVLAENQRGIAQALSYAGAALLLGDITSTDQISFPASCFETEFLREMGISASNLVDGMGTHRVVAALAG